MGNQVKGIVIVSVLAVASVIFGLILIPKALVTNAKERELYRIGKVVDAQVVEEERYTARTLENIFAYDGFTELFVVEEEERDTASTRRTRYRYQLQADGIRFTLRNRPGTRRLRTGSTVTITYDPENVSNFRLYMGEPQLKTGLLISGIGLLAVGAIGVVLLIRFKQW